MANKGEKRFRCLVVILLLLLTPTQAFSATNYDLANTEFRRGNYDKVLTLLRNSHDVPSLILRGRAHRWKDSSSDLDFDEALSRGPKDSNALAWHAFCLFARSRFDQAQPWLERAVMLDPKNMAANALLGYCLVMRGRQQDGLVIINKALMLKGDRALTLELMAKAQEICLDVPSAERSYNELTGSFTDMPAAWVLKGEFLEKSGRIKEAIICYTTSTKLNPRFESGYVRLAKLDLQQKQYSDAIDNSTKCLKMQSGSDEYNKALRVRALSYEALGKWALAIADWKAFMRKDEMQRVFSHASNDAFISISRDYREQGQYSNALATTEKLLKMKPTSREGRIEEAKSLVGLNEKDRALKIYDALIREDDTYSVIYHERAKLLRALGRVKEAVLDEQRAAYLDR